LCLRTKGQKQKGRLERLVKDHGNRSDDCRDFQFSRFFQCLLNPPPFSSLSPFSLCAVYNLTFASPRRRLRLATQHEKTLSTCMPILLIRWPASQANSRTAAARPAGHSASISFAGTHNPVCPPHDRKQSNFDDEQRLLCPLSLFCPRLSASSIVAVCLSVCLSSLPFASLWLSPIIALLFPLSCHDEFTIYSRFFLFGFLSLASIAHFPVPSLSHTCNFAISLVAPSSFQPFFPPGALCHFCTRLHCCPTPVLGPLTGMMLLVFSLATACRLHAPSLFQNSTGSGRGILHLLFLSRATSDHWVSVFLSLLLMGRLVSFLLLSTFCLRP
jgi:hypothetical protein